MKFISYCIYIFCVFFLLLGCNNSNSTNENKISRDNFVNLLDLQFSPATPKDWPDKCFFDQGSWFGFSNPVKSDSAIGFIGPFSILNKSWLCKNLITVNLYENHTELIFTKRNFLFVPGLLIQQFETNNFVLKNELIFESNSEILIRFSLKNLSNKKRNISSKFSGLVFDQSTFFRKNKFGIELNNNKNETLFIIIVPQKNKYFTKIVCKENIYKSMFDNISLLPNENINFEFKILFNLNTNTFKSLVLKERKKETDFKKILIKNTERWNRYLTNVIKLNLHENEKRIIAKSVVTLLLNWKSPVGDLKHDGLIPSFAVNYFDGFWAWDSWKHAVALSKFNSELAKKQILSIFDYQDSLGMVPDVIYVNKSENNWRNTKPPLASWAVWKTFRQNNDIKFLKEIYPKLKKYHYWWYKFRDHNQNGLCEYGSTDGTKTAAMWESGMDDAIRFDSAKILKNRLCNSWSIDQESVDLNSYLYADKIYLSKIAGKLNLDTEKISFQREAKILKEKINSIFFNPITGFYQDKNIKTNQFIKAMGPEGWIPLWAKVANSEQANAVRQKMLNENYFNTYLPLPTVSANNPEYLSGYWRGPVWMDQVYFGIKGLENYNFNKEAEILKNKILSNTDGLKSNLPIYEQYNPKTGKGMKAKHFSWSAASFLLLM